jgi:cytoskeleton protein RodZ
VPQAGPGEAQLGAAAQAMGQPGARVVLRARAATRITIKYPDGRIFVNRDINPGDVIYAGGLEVDLDGRALGRAGADRQVLGRVSLEPQSLIDRFDTR